MTNGNEITFNFSASNWSTTLTVVKSWMGTIHTAGANYIIEGFLEGIAYPLETLNVPGIICHKKKKIRKIERNWLE